MKFSLIQNEELLTSLGLTLLHSLWLISLVTGLTIIILKTVKLTAKQKYNIAFGAQAMALFVVFGCFLWSKQTVSTSILFQGNEVSIDQSNFVLQDVAGTVAEYQRIAWISPHYSQYIGFFWLIGMMILSLKKFASWQVSLRFKNKGLIAIPDQWEDRFKTIVIQAGLRRKVAINISTRIKSPVLIGYLKPLILVPLGFFSELSPSEIESVILHELAHVKRSDYLHLFVQHSINVLLFYHPAIWLLDKIANQERENACDDFVVKTTGDPTTYVKALGQIQLNYSKTQNKMAMNLLNDKNSVLNRLKRLVGEEPKQKVGRKLIILPVIILISGVLLSFSPQMDDNNALDKNFANSELLRLDDNSTLADTSIITLKEIKPTKVKKDKKKEKAKVKVVKITDAKKDNSSKLVVEEIVEEPVEIVEVAIEQPQKLNKIMVVDLVEEEVIVEEVPEVTELIIEEIQPIGILDTIPESAARKMDLLIKQATELRNEFERLNKERKLLEAKEQMSLSENEREQIEKLKKEQNQLMESVKEKAIQSKYLYEMAYVEKENARAEAEKAKLRSEEARVKAEKQQAVAKEMSVSARLSYDDLFEKMNKDGLKMNYGDQINYKIDEKGVYLDGLRLSAKLAKKYREYFKVYLKKENGASTIKMTPTNTIVKWDKE